MNKKVSENDFLFTKIVCSLTCMKLKTKNINTKKECDKFVDDFVNQYEIYKLKRDMLLIGFKYSEKDIVDFCNECYEDADIFVYAEDLEYSFKDLLKNIFKERNKKNG